MAKSLADNELDDDVGGGLADMVAADSPSDEEDREPVASEPEDSEDDAEVSSETSDDSEDSDDTEPETTEEPAESTDDLFARIASVSGSDFRGKYKSEEDLLKGLASAARLTGERNEKAEYFDQFATYDQQSGGMLVKVAQAIASGDRATIDRLGAAVAGQAVPGPQVHATPTDRYQIRSQEDYNALREAVLDENGQRRPSADPAAVRALQTHNDRMQRAMIALASGDPSAMAEVFAPVLGQLKKETLGETQSTLEQRFREQDNARRKYEIDTKYAHLLYENPQERTSPTKFGLMVVREWEHLGKLGVADTAERLTYAIEAAQRSLPQMKKTKKPGRGAMREPAVAAPRRGEDAGKEDFVGAKTEGLEGLGTFLKRTGRLPSR